MTWPVEIREKVAQLLESGLSLREIGAMEGMPDRATVRLWCRDDPTFLTRYARARELQADALFDGMAEIEEKVMTGALDPQAAKVVLWSQQWRSDKLAPKVYGAKIETTHEVGDSITKIVREVVRGTPDQDA